MLCEKVGFKLCFCTAFTTKLCTGGQLITALRAMSGRGYLPSTFGAELNIFGQRGFTVGQDATIPSRQLLS
jgi:hypothetical protein